MKRTFRTLSIAALAATLALPAVSWADSLVWAPSPFRSINASGPSRFAGVRREMSVAQRDLAKALAAVRNDAESVKQAEANVAKARRDYQAALVAARQNLTTDPIVGPLQKQVRELEARMLEQSDAHGRLAVANDLMAARGVLNKAEWESLGIDPDLAISKLAIDDANKALRDARSQQMSQLSSDPAVSAARQRVLALRQQLRGR